MRRFSIVLLSILMIIGLSACADRYDTRPVYNLPQSTRVDRDEIARLSAIDLADVNLTVEDDTTTFFVRDDGTIVFHIWTQTDSAHPISLALLQFKQEVEARSDGQLEVQIRIGAGNDGDILTGVIENQLDAAVITVWTAWSDRNELANLESLPFLFTNYEEAWLAYEGTLGDWVTDNIINPSGARAVGYWTNGLRHFTNNVRPIHGPEDLVGLSMRSMATSTQTETYTVLGAQYLIMPFGEVYPGLEAGDFDGQDNPLGNIHAAHLYEVQRYLSLSSHMFSSAPVILSADFWYFLSPSHQQAIFDSALEAGRYQGILTRAMYHSQLQDMQAAGMSVNYIDTAAFENAVVPVWESHMARFGNEIATIAARYIADTNSLPHRFGDLTPPSQ
ncbi:MAG: TRAP transporter substrate-binding protein DctP [Defluviitaleaceae bacterium]|nr:TRAP transporter substrate-binding protein DctP [Defluviitaleaceae bacterium]